jgi:hypothetical protein
MTLAVVLLVSHASTSSAAPTPAEQGVDAALASTALPTVTLSTYYGGSTEECRFNPCAVTMDQDGNIYLAGPTRSDDFPLTNPYTTTFSPSSGEDIFVIKIAADAQTALYSTYLAPGVAQGVAVDGNGQVYVTGYTSSDAFPTTPNAVHTTYQGGIDAIVAKLSADGSQLLYGSYLGGSERDEGFDIAVDSTGNMHLTGWTNSDDFDTANAYQAARAGDDDAFVTKIDSAGSLAYSTYLGGAENDEGWGIALDSASNAYVTGRSSSDDFDTTPGVVQPDRYSGAAGSDAIVVKMTPVGGLAYGTFFNKTSTNNGVDIAVDAQGSAYVISTHEDVFKLNADASAVLYQTEYPMLEIETNVGGEGGITVDSDGIAYVTGWRGSGGDKDVVVAALTGEGRVVYDRAFGGGNSDRGYSIAKHEDGAGHKRVTVAGIVQSDDFPTVNPLQAQLNGPTDLFILQIDGMENLPTDFVYLPLMIR